MKLICKNCGKPIPARNINIHAHTAVCEYCDSVFSFADELTKGAKTAKLRKVQKPDNIIHNETEDGFDMRIPWWVAIGQWGQSMTPLLVVLALLFTGILINAMQGMTSVGLGVVLALAAMVWFIPVAFMINRIRYVLDAETLKVRHYPLFWLPRTIAREDIEGVRLKPFNSIADGKGNPAHYMLFIQLRDERPDVWIDNCAAPVALYLKQVIEEALQADEEIVDADVSPFSEDDDLTEVDEIIHNNDLDHKARLTR